ncbi:MAG: phosphonate ABC transporter, permease protein PhnE [Planctomycetota bacterium]|nr:MAG: phosphonate ABC transporter, permease protein PhnE [Planctomycetota bacterium]
MSSDPQPPPKVDAPSPLQQQFHEQYRRSRRRLWLQSTIVLVVFCVVVWGSAGVSQFTIGRLWEALPRMGDYIWRTLPDLSVASFWSDMGDWFYAFPRWLRLLLDTIVIAVMATFLGAAGALCLCFTASRNLVARYWLYWIARRSAEVARTIPEIVFALIFVVAFGVGATAGLLAITIHTFGALTKLYSEVNENIDSRPLEGLEATGAHWVQRMRFAVLPQVSAGYITYTLWRLELNIRAAAIIGFVGAGGIGQELYHAISMGYYEDISAIILMIIFTITVIDLGCERMRHHFIGKEVLT